jgi:2-iminobutanoate/2-iminopropanoate deaminase
MTARQHIQPSSLSARVLHGRTLYSHVVSVEGGRMVFVSGQLSRDAGGNIVGRGDMRAQVRQVGENVRAALAAAGARPGDMVMTTTYVTDIDEYFKHVDVRTEMFGPEPPTSTTVEVRRLSHPDLMVEMNAVAVVGQKETASS